MDSREQKKRIASKTGSMFKEITNVSYFKRKVLFLEFLLTICLLMTYYSHFMLKSDVIFTHFFYIPIILAGLWWGRTGILVSIFLAIMLLVLRTTGPVDTPIETDVLRACIFVVVGTVVGTLNEKKQILADKLHIETALRKSEMKNQALINAIPALIFQIYRDGTILYFIHGKDVHLHIPPDELLNKKLYDILPEEPAQLWMHHIERTLQNNRSQMFEYQLQVEGIVQYFEGTVFPYMESQVIVISQDITEPRQSEEELRKTRDYLDNLINYANAPIIVWDPEFKITRFNHAFEHLTGLTFNEVTGRQLGILFPEESRDESLSKIKSTSKGEYWESVEIPILRKNGDIHIVLWNSANIYSEDGSTLLATIAQGHDITGRKQAEEELRKTQDHLEKLITYANAPIIVWDPEFKITRFNHAFEHLTGLTFDEVTGRQLDMLFPEKSRDESLSKIKSTSKGEYWESVEIPILHKDGGICTVLWNSANIYSKDGSTLLATIAQGQDITKRKQAEDELIKSHQELKDTQVQLFQAGKLTAMGEMAAGIVHELTQPLLGIKGFAAAIQEDLKVLYEKETLPVTGIHENLKQIGSDIDVILQQAERMTKIINTARSFARESKIEMLLLDINQPVEDALLLFTEQLRVHNIATVKNLAPDLPGVTGNPNQLEQVFINLITNARDAMDAKGGKGQLTITTRGSDGGIYIEFEDTGTGADTETVSRMFEPFFTTRGADEGTGLGLSIVQRIINDHNGTINTQCEPGRGCKFTIHLPVEGE